MRRRRELRPRERLGSLANSVVGFMLAAGCIAILIWVPDGLDETRVWEVLVLAGIFAFYAASYALVLLRPRKSQTRPESNRTKKQPEPQPWKPPVNEEFERYGEAYFISLTPRFMPRWLAHADPRTAVASSLEAYSLIQLFRPAFFACASFATWCLRKSWTVAVERRNVAGAGEWRFVVREEYGSFRDAFDRRAEIVDDWRTEILKDWPSGDYTPRPFIDEEAADRRDTTTPS